MDLCAAHQGFETTFDGWVTVGGATLATVHGAMGQKDAIGIAPVAGGATFKDAGVDEDPFARLLARRR